MYSKQFAFDSMEQKTTTFTINEGLLQIYTR